MKSEELKGKVALITAGTSGVGLRVAEQLAEAGAMVIVNGRTKEGGEKALKRLEPISPKVRFIAGDVSNYNSIKSVVDQIDQEYGCLDILVSAGAPGLPGPMPFSAMTPEQLEQGFVTRIFPRIFPVHTAIPALSKSKEASVVMLTTDAARHPTPGETVVGAVGAAVMLATKALAKELSSIGIRVNAVAMTITSDTPSWDRAFGSESFQNKLFSKAVSRFPQGRPPNASEVADAISFLLSTRATQITGQTISVNGGLSYGGW
ncbi:SDR family oxidoreductase [Sneathiella chungangensis]|uniref:SDR family oxidoreductase n=1 Tax=Sneathiella chungangensis TaxID=1418234 RepID=A0A845MI71_9PROT|nr:SDR family oxidoreductase [Sneathiella chungangensis]